MPSAEDWMAGIDDDVYVSALAIPGTHNSGACFKLSAPSVRCQGASIKAQLLHGVRFLDLRLSKDYMSRGAKVDNLMLVHGKFPVRLSGSYKFKSVLEDVYSFLHDHPTETVLISVKFENTMLNWDSNSDEFAQVLFQRYVAHNRNRWYLSDKIPTMKYCRGKAVLLRRFPVLEGGVYKRFGIPCTWNYSSPIYSDPHVCVQDFFEIKTPADIDKKVQLIKDMIVRARVHHSDSVDGSDSSAAASSYSSCSTSTSSASSSNLNSNSNSNSNSNATHSRSHSAHSSRTSSTVVASGSSSNLTKSHAENSDPKLFINFCTGASFYNKQFWPSNVDKALRKHNLDQHYSKSCGIVVLDFAERDDWNLVDKLPRVNFT